MARYKINNPLTPEMTMYPRTEYEMTDEDLQDLLQPCMPEMLVGGHSTGEIQQYASNNAWKRLGDKMGFDWQTVQPALGRGQRFFTAIPSETPEAKAERESKEAADAKAHKILQMKNDIANLQKKLAELEIL